MALRRPRKTRRKTSVASYFIYAKAVYIKAQFGHKYCPAHAFTLLSESLQPSSRCGFTRRQGKFRLTRLTTTLR